MDSAIAATKPREEDEVFAEYREAKPGAKRDALEARLVQLLQRHGYAICYLILGKIDPGLVNWAVFQAFHNAHKFRGEAKFSTWYQSLVQNLCRSHWRKEKQRGIEVELSEEHAVTEVPEIITRIPGLTEGDRGLLELRAAGLTIKEIAAQLGVKPGAISTRLGRIKKRVKEAVDAGGVIGER